MGRRESGRREGHDRAPGLHEALLRNGFVPEEPESIMIGEARLLAGDVRLPDGIELRRITTEADMRAMCAMQEDVFSSSPASTGWRGSCCARFGLGSRTELWVAEGGQQQWQLGRLEPVPGTEFAGISARQRDPSGAVAGIYRALTTAARARSALSLGKRLIYSDSTEFSPQHHPRAGRARQGLHDDAVRLVAAGSRRDVVAMRLWQLPGGPARRSTGRGRGRRGGRYSPAGAPVVNFASEAGLAVLVALRYLPRDPAEAPDDYVLGWTEMNATPGRVAGGRRRRGSAPG